MLRLCRGEIMYAIITTVVTRKREREREAIPTMIALYQILESSTDFASPVVFTIFSTIINRIDSATLSTVSRFVEDNCLRI